MNLIRPRSKSVWRLVQSKVTLGGDRVLFSLLKNFLLRAKCLNAPHCFEQGLTDIAQ